MQIFQGTSTVVDSGDIYDKMVDWVSTATRSKTSSFLSWLMLALTGEDSWYGFWKHENLDMAFLFSELLCLVSVSGRRNFVVRGVIV